MSRGESSHGPDLSAWQRRLVEYQRAELSRSLWQLCSALLPYLCLLYLSFRSLAYGAWASAPLLLLAGGFLVRTFVIFHDCAHGSFFRSRRANELAGTLLGVLLFTPFHEWRRRHAIHHAGSSDLDRRGWWDIETLTVREYLSLPLRGRLRYRLYRHPLVLFGLGPLAFFLFIQRLPAPGARRRQRLSVLWTNAGIALTAALISWLVGLRNYLFVQLTVLWLAATVGMWLFYVQHQFERGYWARHGEWDYLAAALRGSSYYKLPRPLQWFTANIGFHHIHHLSTRIPNYNLERCHAENPELQEVNTLTLRSGFRALSVRLWDEDAGRMIGFPRLPEALTRLPLVGAVGGRVTSHAPTLFDEGGARRSMSRAATVTRIVVDERAGTPGRVGALVKRKFFVDYPPFIFNVCFSCGRDGRYCDPQSIWFNVFLGYYEIVAPKSLWSRPFGYDAAGEQAALRFEDVVRIGKADWNYFSNYLYGVPERFIEPYNRVEMDGVGCAYLGRERISAEGAGGAGRYWDVAELDGVEVVSAYVSGRDGHRLESPSLLSPLWRVAFGRPSPRPDHPVSFFPTSMRARLYMGHGEGRDPRLGEVYRTFIFGGTVNRGYRDVEENGRFLDEQAEAMRRVIGRYYPHLGFASHRREAPRHQADVGGRRVA